MEALALPLSETPPPVETRRFSSDGWIVVRGTTSSVFLGGTMVAEFDEQDPDRGRRNLAVVMLAKSGVLHLGHLARAFGITDEYLRQLRRMEEAGGPRALLLAKKGKDSEVSPEQRAAWHAAFAAGRKAKEVYRAQPKPKKNWFSYPTVWRAYKKWQQTRDAAPPAPAPASSTKEAEATHGPALAPGDGQLALFKTDATSAVEAERERFEPTPDEGVDDIVPMSAQPVRSGALVQHAGCWILIALAHQMGLHEEATHAFESRHADGLRIALDAVICALAIYQRCVEGVRRLATPSGPTLLRARRVPSASGVRLLLGRLLEQVEGAGATLDARMTERLVTAAYQRADDGRAVFYIDNHLRPYRGKQTVRKGWRMQDRRVLPGTTDYYVHDEDGRPVFRVAVTSHDSLSMWLGPIAKRLRTALGDEPILLAFDRGGAFVAQLAALRDDGFEFVTYERRPYPDLPASAFDRTIVARGETYGVHEKRLKNLGKGRGRLRRISLRTPDGKQINLVAFSTAPAERLIAIMIGDEGRADASGRWVQENGFKHGTQRWGTNQLDDREVELVPPGTMIPNPARRRLDRALRLARLAEGEARRELAYLAPDDPKRATIERDLTDSLDRQRDIEALRPMTPERAPVEETELAGKLVRHVGQRKAVIDVIRVVCANVEADLAAMLAPHLTRPREAKRVLANVFAAPAKVAVSEHAIHVRLAPAANRSELKAIACLFESLTHMRLVLPSDPQSLPLRFELQLS